MTKKYFLKGYVMQREITLTPNTPTELTLVIDTEHPTKEGLFRGHYTTLLTTEYKMMARTAETVLCEISEDIDGNLKISHVYIDLEDL